MNRRLFFALWPDASVRQAVARVRDAWPVDGRPIPDANLHLTLAFCGSVPEPLVSKLQDARPDELKPFSLCIDRLGGFRQAAIAWAGCRAIPTELNSLAQSLKQMCVESGLAVDRFSFRPHVSLYRHVVRRPEAFPAIEPIEWTVERFCLVQSTTRHDGAEYRVIQETTLR